MKRKKYLKYFDVFLIIILLYSFFLNLDGDPSYLKRLGDWGDEGYWLQNPINKIRYGNFLTDDQSQSFFGAPIYNFIIFVTFKIFGISFFNARIISLFFLILTSAVIYRYFIKLNYSKSISFFISLFFLTIYDNRVYYQWSTPVNIEIFFQTLIIYFVTFKRLNNNLSIIKLSILFLLSYLSKSTSILILPFLILIILFDNISNKAYIKNVIIFLIYAIIPILLLNFYFQYNYPEKFSLFKDLSKINININSNFILRNLTSIKIFTHAFLQTFKFPNSIFLVCIPVFYIVTNIREFIHLAYFQIFRLIEINRKLFVLFLYLFLYLSILIIIGAFGIDRRQINLIPIHFIIFIITINSPSFYKRSVPVKIIFHILLAFILYFQYNNLLNYLNLDFQKIEIKILFSLFIISHLIINIYLIENFNSLNIIYFTIFINLIFHLSFNRKSNTLLKSNLVIKSIINKQKTFIVGSSAHQLSIQSNTYPVWLYSENDLPKWNKNFNFFKNNNNILINKTKNQKFNDFEIPSNYKIFHLDTLYLYPKFQNSEFVDTTFLIYYKHK